MGSDTSKYQDSYPWVEVAFKPINDHIDRLMNERDEARAEVKRLREENKDLTATLDQVVHERDKAMAEAKALAEAEGE